MSKDERLEPTVNTLKRLYADSAGYCALCMKPLIHRDSKMVGRIAHIRAVSKGGARYDDNMSAEDKRMYENLMYICSPCHDYIDDESHVKEYPAERLIQEKYAHIDKMQKLQQSFVNLTSGVDYVRPITLKSFFAEEGQDFDDEFYKDNFPYEMDQFNALIDTLRSVPPNVRRFYKELIQISDQYKEGISYAMMSETIAMDQIQLQNYARILTDKKLIDYDEDENMIEFKPHFDNIETDFITRIALFKKPGVDILEESFVNLDFSWAD